MSGSVGGTMAVALGFAASPLQAYAPTCQSHRRSATVPTQFAQHTFAFRPVRPSRSSRAKSSQIRAGLFDFLNAGAATKKKPQAEETVNQLLELVSPTNAGLKASPQTRAEAYALVDQLRKYCPRNPVRSPLFWGKYKVLYSSKPAAPGGPFRSGPGRLVFPFQQISQVLEPPSTFINRVEYRALGLIPGKEEQQGELQAVGGNQYKVDLQTKGGMVQRRFEVLYLDERLRVVRTISDASEDVEPVTFVFQRVQESEEEEEEEEEVDEPEVEEEEEPKPAKARGGFGGLGGLLAKPDAGAASEQAVEAAAAALPSGTRRVRQGRQAAAGADPEAEARKKEKEAEVRKREEIRQQLDELTGNANGASEEAKEAAASLRERERLAGSSSRQAKGARSRVEKAEAETQQMRDQYDQLAEQQRDIEQELQEAIAKVRELEKTGKSFFGF